MTLVLSPRNWPLLLMAGLAVAVAVSLLGPLAQGQIPAPSAHANQRHGPDADLARQCLDGRPGYVFYNPASNRYGIVCETDGGWGVVILDAAGREITAFIKNKMTRFEQVLRYMQNSGYKLSQ